MNYITGDDNGCLLPAVAMMIKLVNEFKSAVGGT